MIILINKFMASIRDLPIELVKIILDDYKNESIYFKPNKVTNTGLGYTFLDCDIIFQYCDFKTIINLNMGRFLSSSDLKIKDTIEQLDNNLSNYKLKLSIECYEYKKPLIEISELLDGKYQFNNTTLPKGFKIPIKNFLINLLNFWGTKQLDIVYLENIIQQAILNKNSILQPDIIKNINWKKIIIPNCFTNINWNLSIYTNYIDRIPLFEYGDIICFLDNFIIPERAISFWNK